MCVTQSCQSSRRLALRSDQLTFMRIQATGNHLQEVGVEYGVTTGRRRRCGWLDLVVVRYSHLINGYTSFNLTKLDVLDQLPELKICTGYELDGKLLATFPGAFPRPALDRYGTRCPVTQADRHLCPLDSGPRDPLWSRQARVRDAPWVGDVHQRLQDVRRAAGQRKSLHRIYRKEYGGRGGVDRSGTWAREHDPQEECIEQSVSNRWASSLKG